MKWGRRGRLIVATAGAAILVAVQVGSAIAATNLDGALIEQLGSSGFVAQHTPQPNSNAYTTSNPGYPQGWTTSGITAASSTDAWAVGGYLDRTGTSHAATEHWNGSTWQNISNAAAPAASGLSGVTALSASDVWAVGSYFATLNGQRVLRTFAEHWDGTRWSRAITPNPDASASDNLSRVSGSSSTDVWALGQSASGHPFFEHWNGTAWSIVVPVSSSIGANSLSVDSPTDAWAALGGGAAESVLHWDGHFWRSVAGVFPNGYEVNAVFAASSRDVWAIGNSLQASDKPVLFEHWNGSTWTAVSGQKPGYRSVALSAAAGSSSADVYAVGYVVTQSYPASNTLAEHWNGTTWSIVHSQNPSTIDPGVNGSLLDYFTAVTAVPGAAFVSGYQGKDQGG